MKLTSYSVLDTCMQCYGTPFYAINDQVATRAFIHATQDPNTTLSKSPEDFTLYALSEFDDQTGTYSNITPPRFVMRASSKVHRVDPTVTPNDPYDDDPRR